MPKVKDDYPKALRPFYGTGLDLSINSDQAVGRCPFCEREKKFSVNVETGLWRCYVCNEGADSGNVIQGGNVYTYLRKLHERGDEITTVAELASLAKERGFLSAAPLKAWGVVKSPITGEWMIPGYSIDGALCQLYRWVRNRSDGSRRLLPAAELGHKIHGANLYDDGKPSVIIAEGPWDGMALWEALGAAKQDDDGLSPTGAESSSLLATTNVIAMPGCKSFLEPWATYFGGKRVVLIYDSDFPREVSGRKMPPDGSEGMRRVASMLGSSSEPPAEIHYVNWGEDGYDPTLKNGYDARDHLGSGKTLRDRVGRLGELMSKIEPVPESWLAEAKKKLAAARHIEPTECKTFAACIDAWRRALAWGGTHGQCLEDVIAVMMAVSTSTVQRGDQLFLQVIGSAGSAKSRFCDAMLVSKKCYPLEHLTGFHSGYKDASGEDFSLLARIDRKCLITPEGDVLMSSPKFDELMSQQRRIFDGTSGASYKNRKEDVRYTGLRTPWIIAGTPAMMDRDQSRLGDRFLKVFINLPSASERDHIVTRAFYSAIDEVASESNCSASSTVSGDLLQAYRMTGGYVEYLRANSSRLLAGIGLGEYGPDQFGALAEFAASLRARPCLDPRKKHGEAHDTQELPTRLVKQFARLGVCLAAVLNRKEIDADVFRRVRKVAVDTASGQTMELCSHLRAHHPEGKTLEGLKQDKGRSETMYRLMIFLQRMFVVEQFRLPPNKGLRWRLTPRFKNLWDSVVGVTNA